MDASIVIPAVAVYGAVMSTVSFILAFKVFKAGNPDVELGWEYSESNLWLQVINTGRADVTISAIDLCIENHATTRRSPISDHFAMRVDIIEHIPGQLWRGDDAGTSFRLGGFDDAIIPVNHAAIRLPSELPVDQLFLKFVARYPGGRQVVYMRADHFLDIDRLA